MRCFVGGFHLDGESRTPRPEDDILIVNVESKADLSAMQYFVSSIEDKEQIRKGLTRLKSLNIVKRKKTDDLFKNSRYGFNCWGLTSYLLKWKQKAAWIDDREMQKLLQAKAQIVSNPRVGDIVAFYDYFKDWDGKDWDKTTIHVELQHTAIIIPPVITIPPSISITDYPKRSRSRWNVIHKDGMDPIKIELLGDVYSGSIKKYYRPTT